MADSERRVELVGKSNSSHEPGRVGLGLIIGLVAGHRALLAAATGRGAFESSLGSFVFIVLVCVGAMLFLGNLYDRLARQAKASIDDELHDDPDSDEFDDDDLHHAEDGVI